MLITIPAKSKQSKETKTAGKTPSEQEFSKDHGNPIGDQLQPFMDKIALSIPWPDGDMVETMTKTVPASMKKMKDVYLPAKKKGPFQNAFHVSFDSVSHDAYLQWLPYSSSSQTFARLEFNPALLGPSGMQYLHELLEDIMPDGFAHLRKVAKVYRIDASIDVHGIRMDEFMALNVHGTTAKEYATSGHLETIYLGKLKTSHTVIYDKTKQLKAKAGGKQVVRVERRLIGQKMPVCEMGSLKNPFAHLKVAPCLPGPPPGEKGWQWSMFEDSVKVRGLKNVLALIPEDRAKLYRDHLLKHPAGWWEPEDIWKRWPAYLDWLQTKLPANAKLFNGSP